MSPQLQHLDLLFLKYSLLLSVPSSLLFAPSLSTTPSKLSLFCPLGQEKKVLQHWGSSAGLWPCPPPGLTHFLIRRKLNLKQTSVVVGGRGFTDEMHSFLFLKNHLSIF